MQSPLLHRNPKQLFIVPQKQVSFIATVEHEEIVKIKNIGVPYTSKNVIAENGRIISICPKKRVLRIFDPEGRLIFKKIKFPLLSIACKQNTVYLGGEYHSKSSMQGEVLWCLNVDQDDFIFQEIALPIRLTGGKSIDDLVIRDEELIAVDNIIYPKYILRYNISSLLEPKHLETIKLPLSRTYESIIKGDCNADWLILFSSSFGRNGSYQHLTFTGKREEVISIQRSTDEEFCFKDICILKNDFYLLRSDGIGKIDLNGKISLKAFEPIETQGSDWDKLIKTPAGNIILVKKEGYELLKPINKKRHTPHLGFFHALRNLFKSFGVF